jgi:UDP-glucose 4-epimerase
VEFVPYSRAYAPGFDDMRRRKPVTGKLAAAVGFRPTTPLRQIIELTAATLPS